MGKTSDFDNIYTKYQKVAKTLQFWGIFCLWSLKNWVGKYPPCPPSSTAPAYHKIHWLLKISGYYCFLYSFLMVFLHFFIKMTGNVGFLLFWNCNYQKFVNCKDLLYKMVIRKEYLYELWGNEKKLVYAIFRLRSFKESCGLVWRLRNYY